MNWKAVLQWIGERASEKSTWAGLIAIVTPLTGLVLSADQAAAVTTAGMAIAGLILVLTKTDKGA